jgi:hypothetical protein
MELNQYFFHLSVESQRRIPIRHTDSRVRHRPQRQWKWR